MSHKERASVRWPNLKGQAQVFSNGFYSSSNFIRFRDFQDVETILRLISFIFSQVRRVVIPEKFCVLILFYARFSSLRSLCDSLVRTRVFVCTLLCVIWSAVADPDNISIRFVYFLYLSNIFSF